MRLVIAILGLLMIGILTPAQTHQHHDFDVNVAGNGIIPEGWQLRFDHKNDKSTEIQFTIHGDVYHFESGPAAIYYNKKDMTKGNFKSSAEFLQTKASRHPEAYGIFWAGKDLKGKNQHYYYFLVRQDGKYLIKTRNGDKTSLIVDWTANDAVKAKNKNGQTKNTLEVDVKGNKVNFIVNGKQVANLPKSKFQNTEGQVGLRINHNLNVKVTNFTVSKL